MIYANNPIPITGNIKDNIAAGNIPKNLKLAGPIIEVILLTSQIFLSTYEKTQKALINMTEHVKQKALFNKFILFR